MNKLGSQDNFTLKLLTERRSVVVSGTVLYLRGLRFNYQHAARVF